MDRATPPSKLITFAETADHHHRNPHAEYRSIEARIAGHLELLVDNGYVEGVRVLRGIDGHIALGISNPRLTMAGHDLLDTMRSKPVWDKVKETAQSKGIELTFDAVKMLGTWALKQIIGT
ncbi:YjcQ family protein [Burkholderia glumae]